MSEFDSLQRFIFEHANIRGEVIHLQESYQAILEQHDYPHAVKKILGEALMATVMLAGSIQFEGELSLQFHGDKRLPLLLIQCNHNLELRGFAKFEPQHNNQDNQPIDYENAFLNGKMVLNINQYNQTQAYQSIIPIQSISIAKNLTNYFTQSEQLETRVWFATDNMSYPARATGLLIQAMPLTSNTNNPSNSHLNNEQFWEYAVKMAETITEHELLNLNNTTMLYRLYHETEVRLFPARDVSFHCRCNIEKMKQVISMLGKEDIDQLIKEKNEVAITCDFCNKKYIFDAIDTELIFRKSGPNTSDIWVEKI